MKHTLSEKIFNKSKTYIPGGVNSPVRAFNFVEGDPITIKSGNGSTITDADGNDYIDFLGSWGPLILGHAHPEIINAVHNATENGLTFGVDNFGKSAPYKKIYEHFNLTSDNIVKLTRKMLNK